MPEPGRGNCAGVFTVLFTLEKYKVCLDFTRSCGKRETQDPKVLREYTTQVHCSSRNAKGCIRVGGRPGGGG